MHHRRWWREVDPRSPFRRADWHRDELRRETVNRSALIAMPKRLVSPSLPRHASAVVASMSQSIEHAFRRFQIASRTTHRCDPYIVEAR